MNSNKITPAALWNSILNDLQRELPSTEIKQSARQIGGKYAELYIWNRFTIQFRNCRHNKITGELTNKIMGYYVEIYFDSEFLEDRNEEFYFEATSDNVNLLKAINKFRELYKKNIGSLYIEAVSELEVNS